MTETFNTSGLTEAEIEKLPKLGEFRNNWRQRHVTLYAHPHLSEAVVSVGVGFGEALKYRYVATEARSDYERQLGGDWSATQ